MEVVTPGYHDVRDVRRRLLLSLGDGPWCRGMRRLCEETAPAVVHVNQTFEGDGIELIRAAAGYGKARVAGTIHMRVDPPGASRILGWGKRALLRPFFRRYPYLKIFPSSFQMAGFAAAYGDDGSLRHVPNGMVLPEVPTEGEVRESKEALGLSGRTVLAYLGRITPEKGSDWLAKSFLSARRTFPDLFLLVLGEGPGRPSLERALAGGADGASWRCTGWVPEVRHYLCAADMVILPTKFDILSYSVAEALSMGIPCVTTPYEGLEELRARGARVEAADRMGEAAFSERLVKALGDLDGCRARAREGVRAVRENFGFERMAEETAGLYEG
jgi:glycosyltransferase involved in cell wall biosynthesis